MSFHYSRAESDPRTDNQVWVTYEVSDRCRVYSSWISPPERQRTEMQGTPDGARTVTRITNGYLQLLGDWIRGRTGNAYGRGRKLEATERSAATLLPAFQN